MAGPKNTIAVTLDKDTAAEFEKVARGAHLTKTAFAAVILSRFADLKQDAGLHGLTAIPKDLFKAPRGRPPSGAGRTNPLEPALVENVS